MFDRLLALDPGLKHAGLAYFEQGILSSVWTFNPVGQLPDAAGWRNIAELVASQLHIDNQPGNCRIVYEMPQFIPGWRKGDLNAILQVAGAAGTIVARLSPWLAVLEDPIALRPSEWTGSRPKKVNHVRMWGRLTMYEQHKLADACQMPMTVLLACIRNGDEAELEHALDAICVGLKVLGRFDRET